MTGTLRDVGKRGDVLPLHTPVILRASAKSSTPVTLPTPTESQVGQVATVDHLEAPPKVVDGEVIVHAAYRSPLGPNEDGRFPTSLRGGVITDPAEIEQIRGRVERREGQR